MITRNAFEATARAAKISKLLGWIPAATSPEQNTRVADRLAAFTVKERLAFALGAGIKTGASETTWNQLVATVRARRVAA